MPEESQVTNQDWGDGQFDEVEIGPGVRVQLRVTKAGEVKMLCPGGELDVTAGGTMLGLGLLECGKRAAQIRVNRDGDGHKRRKGRSK